MKHISLTGLKRLRWLFVGYGMHFLLGYIVVAFLLAKGWHGNLTYSYIVGGIAAIHILYELSLAWVVFRKSPWVSTIISFAFAFVETFVVFELIRTYKSPFVVVLLAFVFLAGALSQFAPPALSVLVVISCILSLTGVLPKDGGIIGDLVVLGLSIALAASSYFFWRRFYIVANKDSKELKKLDTIIKSHEAQSNILIESITDGVIVTDTKGTITLLNPAGAVLCGWKPDEATGIDVQAVIKLMTADGKPLGQYPFDTVLATKSPINEKLQLTNKVGTTSSIVSMVISPIIIPQTKEMVGAVAVFRDVSEATREEQQRAEFISTASHEMRTPVAAIEGYLALAMNDKVSKIDTKAREYLEKAHSSTQHLGKLFQDLLTSAKAEDGRLVSHPTVVEMGAFIDQVADSLRFAAEKKGLLMEYIVGASTDGTTEASGSKVVRPLYYVNVDADRLREVITNLFDNAVKYTPAGKVSLGLTGNEEVVQLFVRDTGPGIPPTDLPHLFQKFYRVDNSSTRTIGGTGLGLFISRKIIELYKGRIWAESELGKGSTFYINVPRLTSQKASELQKLEAQSTVSAPVTSLTTPVV